MSSGTVRPVSFQDIDLVKHRIEQCLMLYMSKEDVTETLMKQAKINPVFTETVWEKLEEENKDFFISYHGRLQIIKSITEFNNLIEEHINMQSYIPKAYDITWLLTPNNNSV